jgi:WD40 repeat protein
MNAWRRKRAPKAQALTDELAVDASPEMADAFPEMADASQEMPDAALQMRGLERVHRFEDAPEGEYHIAWSADGAFLAAGGDAGSVAVWSENATSPRFLHGHSKKESVFGLAWHPVRMTLATAGLDGTVRLWDLATGESRLFCRLEQRLSGVAWSPDGSRLAVTDDKGGIGVWDSEGHVLLNHAQVLQSIIYRPRWSADGTALIIGCGGDANIIVLASNDLQPRQMPSGSGRPFASDDTALSPDGRLVALASGVVRVCDAATGAEVVVLEGQHEGIGSVCFSPSGEFLASQSRQDVRLWRCRDWECVAIGRVDAGRKIGGLDFHPVQPILAMKNAGDRTNDCFRIDYDLLRGAAIAPGSRRYVNAKVVLLGDTGVGKSGLGLVLSGQPYQKTDSTHGRNVWTFDTCTVEVPGFGEQTREVMLWDLAGQPGYRMVHQLHLNEVAVALVVFDSRSETDPFSGVKHWVRALNQARLLEGTAAVPLKCYLVAARVDRGGVAVTPERTQAMVRDLGLDDFFETSAKEGWQVTDLEQAIRNGIAWDALPMVSSSELFDSIKGFLLEEKKQGRLLSTADDLFRGFLREQGGSAGGVELRASFETCIGRVESRGLIRRLHFGDLVLLQPELLDAYASAIVEAAKQEPDGLGFIPEEEALAGRFRLAESERVPDREQEKLLLIATVEELLRHEIALKEVTDRGVDLVFPSQFTRERPDTPEIPGTAVTFTFEGPLHSVYATLAVRLSQSRLFKRQDMWQNAASYAATVGGTCGIHLHEIEEGSGELALFYDEQAGDAVRIQFEAYVSEHLQFRALPGTVSLRRTLACPACGYVLPSDLIRRRRERGTATIRCPDCEKSVISLQDAGSPSPAGTAVAEMNRNANEGRDQNVAATRLKGKIETRDYDVFLCYNSRERQAVEAIGERLKEHGILPWLDIWEMQAGDLWQKVLEKQLKSIRSAAVFIGPNGSGPWQDLEVMALLQQFGKPGRGRRIIPVILEGRKGSPRFPAFLGLWHAVDMREPKPDPFQQLVGGITREKD